MWRECLAVAVGGAVGSLGRYGLLTLFSWLGGVWLPVATLTANVLGCLAIGGLAEWTLQQGLPRHWGIIGAQVGLLGGLTTFSSFALDVIRLWQTERAGLAVVLALTHVGLGLLAAALGMFLARQAVVAA